MKKIALLLIIFLIIPIYVSAARLKVHLRELNPNKKRELVMDPEVWYDTEEHIIDVTMHSNRNRGCTTGITKSIFVKSINSDYLYVEY